MSGKRDTGEYTSTKERITHTALRLFSLKGFKGTTIKDIAREVGITEGAIYRHFRSKEEIVEYLVKRVSGELGDLLSAKVLSHSGIVAQVKALAETLINYAFDNPDSFRFLTVYHLLKADSHKGKLPGGLLMENFRKAYLRGELAVLPEVALSLAVGTVERLFILWEFGVVKAHRNRLIREVQESLARALYRNGCGGGI